MKQKSKLGIKLLIPLITAVVLGIVLVVGISLAICGKGLSNLSTDYSEILVEDYSRQVESQLALTLNTAETLSKSIRTTMKREDAQRSDILDLVRPILESHTELVGIGVGFDPDAFDGKDSQNIGQKHSDENGRFVPYSFRTNGGVDYTILSGYDDAGPDGSWYSVPKSTNKTYVTAPYWYEVDGEKYLIVTCVSPILDDNGKFIGMVGFDTLLSSLNEILAGADIYDSGYIVFISPDGTIAYHPDSAQSGASIYDTLPKNITDAVDQVYQSGSAKTLQERWEQGGEMNEIRLMPIQVGESGGDWIVITSTAISEINKTMNTSVILALGIGVLVTIMIILIVLMIVKKMVLKPVAAISGVANQLAGGKLNIHLAYQGTDELGELARSIQSTGSQLTTYVSNISETLEKMADGDFTVKAEIDYIGDLMPIKTSMNLIADHMRSTMSEIRTTAEEVASGSHQVAAGAQTLASGTATQASSVEELAATVNEISEHVKSNAEHAKQASRMADDVGAKMTENNKKMQDMVSAMSEINQSSEKISKIIKTIEDIAFQTNILALNAAVEAARAGSAGKGFAVVADEVRNLASKSAEASKDTSDLIEASFRAVTHGTAIAQDTAESLVTAVDRSREVALTIDKISVATDNQAVSLQQVTQGVEQISSVVQMNSATAEESSATSEELSGQAQELKTLVSGFKL